MKSPRDNQCQSLFTALRIGQALGLSRSAVHQALKSVPPSGIVAVQGGEAKAWTLDALPLALRSALDARAPKFGCRDAAHLLASPPPKRWESPVPLSEIAPRFVEKADKLRRALASTLARIHDREISSESLVELGLADFERVFGYRIGHRHWRRLLNRILDRDGGAGEFDRLEIYLDDRIARNAAAPRASCAAFVDIYEISRAITSFKDPKNPTPAEAAMLWQYTFEEFERMIADGKSARKVKRRLLNFLCVKAPFIASGPHAIRRQFERKLARWIAGDRLPGAIEDQRPKKSGWHRAPNLTQEDQDKIVGHAVLFNGGRVSQAWRELLASEGLSEELADYYLQNPSSKSYMPQKVRDQVKWEVALLEDIHHGPRQAQLNGAFISRDWSCVHAGDWYQADDCTLPIYYFEPDGKGWFHLVRGQFLLMVDLRSTCILAYALLSERNYNSLAIRTLITKTCDEHGLPREGFYFERGIWKNSRIITGDRRAGAVSWPEAEKGLRDLELKFIHAKLPRAKPVERVLGAMQNLMEGVTGYAGRDERHDKFERVQRLKLEVEARKISPEGHFLSGEQWQFLLDDLCQKYNAERQDGKMTEGLSPAEAFRQFQNAEDKQTRLFDASCRYLLSHHRRPVRVTRNGVTLRFGRKVFNYRDETTGRLIGQTVLAWFNPEAPDVLCISDLDRKNVHAIERSQEPPALEPEHESFAQEKKRIAAHQAHALTRYRVLRAEFQPQFRRNLVDRATGRLGTEMTEQEAAAREKSERGTTRLSEAQRKGLALVDEAEREHSEQQKEAGE